MKKRLFAVLLTLLIVAGFSLFARNKLIPIAQAVPITQTRIIYSEIDDGYNYHYLPTYTPTHDATYSKHVYTIHVDIGQDFDTFPSNYYYVWRGFVFFDTAILPDDANVTEAKISLYLEFDFSNTDFNITIQNGQPTYPHKPRVSADYYYGHYSGDGGQFNTSGIAAGYNNITLNTDGRGWINLQDITKLCLRSSRDINSDVPTAEEYVAFYSREDGESKSPKLYITYETEGYRYLLHGPYYESGSVAQTTVNVTLSIENTDPFNFVLNGTSGTADEEDIQIEQRGVAFTWNFSSYMNYSRTYFLTSATFEEIWIYIPNTATESVNIYTFTVTDMVGVTNAYLETVHTVGGQNRIVERQSLNVINSVPHGWKPKPDS